MILSETPRWEFEAEERQRLRQWDEEFHGAQEVKRTEKTEARRVANRSGMDVCS